MKYRTAICIGCVCALLAAFDVPGAVTAATPVGEDTSDSPLSASAESADSRGPTVLWTDRDIETLDLFYGPGGQAGSPDVSGTFEYAGVDRSGTQKKIIVTDDRGREWTVKYGSEARPETAATRIVWAMGYHADQAYFVDVAQIRGLPGDDSVARRVRFERRDDGLEHAGEWKWDQNPFIGTRELDGLKTLMVILNNWDLKTINNKILRAPQADSTPRIFYVGDLGATFGKTGSIPFTLFGVLFPVPAGTKGEAHDYAEQDLVDDVHDGFVKFNYRGKQRSAVADVSIENARWMGDRLARLSEAQIEDAFLAAGYSDSDVAILASALHKRIAQLQRIES